MTDFIRFSWLAERGAPSRPGVRLPAWGGERGESIEAFMFRFLPIQVFWRKSIKIMP
jgi:hypothetical protein